jgi:periplasmic protein TonB
MSQTAVLRATSLVTSGALLAAIAIAGLTMSISLRANLDAPDGPTITTIERPPPEPPPPRPIRQPMLPPPIADAEPMETELAPFELQDELVEIDVGPVLSDPLPTITRPTWVRQPRDLQAYYPPRPLARNVEGDVALNCVVRVTGLLDCEVASETPAGWGFANAALRIARDYRMVPAMRDGVAVEGRYRMRVPSA